VKIRKTTLVFHSITAKVTEDTGVRVGTVFCFTSKAPDTRCRNQLQKSAPA